MSRLLLRDVEVNARRCDVLVSDATVERIEQRIRAGNDVEIIDGGGGALLPGLWDHHIHLAALAAALRSVAAGPPDVRDAEDLRQSLTSRATDTWVRAVGYHESVAGDLDRHELDALGDGRAVRLQHRSGACWVLSDEAIRRLGLEDRSDLPSGAERDHRGRLTGRFFRADHWLRETLGQVATESEPPDLTSVGSELASYGVVGCTDATPHGSLADIGLIADATASGALPQRVMAMTAPQLADAALPAPLVRGPVKLLLHDHDLPALEQVAGWISAAHSSGRAVAVHCVTLESLLLTLSALDVAGSLVGDRIEHGAVVPPELGARLREHRLTVVTQPSFVAERGDQYLADVHTLDVPHLYPCGRLLDDDVPVAGSTDAPFGSADPWRAMRAAVERRTDGGRVLGSDDRLGAEAALGLFLGTAEAPAMSVRTIEPGVEADLVLLDRPLPDALKALSADAVSVTIVGGRVVYRR